MATSWPPSKEVSRALFGMRFKKAVVQACGMEDPEFYLELLTTFFDTVAKKTLGFGVAAREALIRGEASIVNPEGKTAPPRDHLRDIAHSIKGTGGNLCLKEVYSEGLKAQKGIEGTEDMTVVLALYDGLLRTVEDAKRALGI